jgi:hypothetical protein
MKWVALAAALAMGGCATASGPPASAVAVEIRSGAADTLRGARTVWVAGAVSRTGTVAAGLSGQAAAPAESSDQSEALASAVRRQRGLELATARDAADLVLYFEQADRLRCWGCRQPENLWYWWGLVLDRSGRELASLHGETEGGPEAAAREFVKSVKTMARPSRQDR